MPDLKIVTLWGEADVEASDNATKSSAATVQRDTVTVVIFPAAILGRFGYVFRSSRHFVAPRVETCGVKALKTSVFTCLCLRSALLARCLPLLLARCTIVMTL
eukprot:scpid68722/ scgid33234/ 